MRVVKPTIFKPTMLLATNAVESVPAWSSTTTYGEGAQSRIGGRIYQSLAPSNLNYPPSLNILKWADVGPDNTNAAFDDQVSTVATGTAQLTYTLAPGIIDALALVNVSAATVSITVRDGPGGAVLYEAITGMDGSTVTDWYQYFFFDPLLVRTQVLFDGIPPFGSAHVSLALIGSVVSVGHIAFGRVNQVGGSQFGPRAGMVDYSRKETDPFGVTTFVRRAFSKTLDISVVVDNVQINRVQRLLYDLRATPCIWIGADLPQFDELLTVFGFYRSFSTDIQYSQESLCTIELEGLA